MELPIGIYALAGVSEVQNSMHRSTVDQPDEFFRPSVANLSVYRISQEKLTISEKEQKKKKTKRREQCEKREFRSSRRKIRQ